jgi:GTP-binding protein HflX
LQLVDSFDLDGVPTPRIFLSAMSGEGIPALRQQLAALARLEPKVNDLVDYSPDDREDAL